MSQILLSIKPEHVENILQGTKRYEFRKVRCRDNVDKIIIYSTAPQKQVVAEADVEKVITGNVNEVWERTKDFAGVSHDFYNAYYEGKEKAVAYQLRNVQKYDSPKSLADFGISFAPQSFVYV